MKKAGVESPGCESKTSKACRSVIQSIRDDPRNNTNLHEVAFVVFRVDSWIVIAAETFAQKEY
jgi:hypothetical protein